MMLLDVLEMMDENTNVNVLLMGDIVTYYDGKNSIDEWYNDYKVIGMFVENNTLNIEIME